MRKLIFCLFIIGAIGSYLVYVRGWDLDRLRAETVDKLHIPYLSAAPATGPIGTRGTGTHWETAAPMQVSRSDAGAVLLAGKIYVLGGIDGYGRTLRTVEAYDIEKNTWSYALEMPQALHHPAVTTDGTRIYVLGGYQGINSEPVDSAYAFEPQGGVWTELGHLNDFRGGGAGAFLNGLYFVGGTNQAGPTGSTEAYDGSNGRWDSRANMPTPRARLTIAAAGGKLYAIGGSKGSLENNLDTVEVYDPERNAWNAAKPMPHRRSSIASAAVGDQIYVFGGETTQGTVPDVDVYDIRKNQWKSYGLALPTARHGLAAVAYKNRIYVIGGGRRSGFSVSDKNEVLILDGKLLGWSEKKQLELMK